MTVLQVEAHKRDLGAGSLTVAPDLLTGNTMFTCNDRRGPLPRVFRCSSLGAGVVGTALILVLACSSNDAAGTGAGGSSASGGHAGGTGGDAGGGGSVAAGRGGVSGKGGGGSGGVTGAGGIVGVGGHDISPVLCGNGFCPLTFQCCVGCNGAPTCAPSCAGFACTDAGAGGNGGAGPADAAEPDAANDASAALACGTMTCGPQEACVHPPGPGTCLMPDGGQCPSGTSLMGGCCLPPLIPSCVAIDRPCSGPTVTCACFSTNPCGSQLCAGASFQGRVVMCHGA
jgi:hypothetical protein